MNKILVTGGNGMVGKELKQILTNAIFIDVNDYDLTIQHEVDLMFNKIQPDIIIHLAAKVGGIEDNMNNQLSYFSSNILMNTFIIDYALKYNVKKFIGILSTCIYPAYNTNFQYPLPESFIQEGPPEVTNLSYAVTKRAMATHIDCIREKYGYDYSYLIPCNMYGIHDKYDSRSHFIGSLLNKIYEAKNKNNNFITLFGDGTPHRQFLHSKDLANIIKLSVENNIYENMNVATEENYTIKELAEIALDICNVSNFKIIWDKSKPNGQYRKDVNIDKFKTFFPNYDFINIKDGIKQVYYEKFEC